MKTLQKRTVVKTRKQIADEYGICVRTLRRRTKKHNIELSPGLLYPVDQNKIYAIFGNPKSVR